MAATESWESRGAILYDRAASREARCRFYSKVLPYHICYHKAASTYEKSGGLFEAGQLWNSAAEAYLKAAELHRRCRRYADRSAKCYVAASNCYKRFDAEKWVLCQENAMMVLATVDACESIAKIAIQLARYYEVESQNRVRAAAAYEQAANMLELLDKFEECPETMATAAWLYAESEMYAKAIELFERAAREDEGMLKRGLSLSYLLRAALCYLCAQDPKGLGDALKRYDVRYLRFSESPHKSMLHHLLQSYQMENTAGLELEDSNQRSLIEEDPLARRLLERAGKTLLSSMLV